MTSRWTDRSRRQQGKSLPVSHRLSVDTQFACSYLGTTNWKPAEIRATEPAGWARGAAVA